MTLRNLYTALVFGAALLFIGAVIGGAKGEEAPAQCATVNQMVQLAGENQYGMDQLNTYDVAKLIQVGGPIEFEYDDVWYMTDTATDRARVFFFLKGCITNATPTMPLTILNAILGRGQAETDRGNNG